MHLLIFLTGTDRIIPALESEALEVWDWLLAQGIHPKVPRVLFFFLEKKVGGTKGKRNVC